MSFATADSCLQTFTVPVRSASNVPLPLNQGDAVEGNIAVIGGLNNDINFNIIDPNGNTIRSYSLVTHPPFQFPSRNHWRLHFSF